MVEEEQAGNQQSGGAVERGTPLSHFTGAGPRLRQIPRDNAPLAPPPSPRGVRARHH